MFGMGFSEVLVIAIVAILFLGPEKLPDAMVKVAKFLKGIKNSVNDVKSSFEQEMKIQELKEEALNYKKKLEETTASVKKAITFDELEEIKKSTASVNDSLKELQNKTQEDILAHIDTEPHFNDNECLEAKHYTLDELEKEVAASKQASVQEVTPTQTQPQSEPSSEVSADTKPVEPTVVREGRLHV